MTDGRRLIVEIKGADQNRDAAVKAAAAERWCSAVNNDGRFGRWHYHVVYDPAALGGVLR
jgi:type III restriction enzyme